MLFVVLVVIVCFAGADFGTGYTDLLEKAHCPINYDCTWTYPYYITQRLKCSNNRQCPNGFACCRDCHYQHRVCKTALWLPQPHQHQLDLIKRHCPNTSTIYCPQQFPYVGTEKYKCTTNDDCDYGLLCCSDFCYNHKICKEPISDEEIAENTNVCPEDSRICARPSTYEKTSMFRCETHGDCPKSFACCYDGCFAHKICKPKQTTQESYDSCPISIRRKSCINTNRNLTKYACSNRHDCVFGYVCCEDNCYDHKVCKLPTGAFSYQDVYKPQNLKVGNSDENHQCLPIEEKCLKPYSLRLAKKFICTKDEDCQLGQLCCKDSCVKDFKICKNVFEVKIDIQSVNSTVNTKETYPQPKLVDSAVKYFSSTTKKTIDAISVVEASTETFLHDNPIDSSTFNTKLAVLATSGAKSLNDVTEKTFSVFLVPTASTKKGTTSIVATEITEKQIQSSNGANWKTPSVLFDDNNPDLATNSTTTEACRTFCSTTLNPETNTPKYEYTSSSELPTTTLGTICGKPNSKKQQQDSCLLKSYKTGNTDVEFYFDELNNYEIDQGSGSGYADEEDIF